MTVESSTGGDGGENWQSDGSGVAFAGILSAAATAEASKTGSIAAKSTWAPAGTRSATKRINSHVFDCPGDCFCF
jgi:hypothetical protein